MGLLGALRQLRRYPTAIIGLAIVAIAVCVGIYTMIAIPYSEGIRLWRGGGGVWEESPRNARPVYFDLFTSSKLSRTIVSNLEEAGTKIEEPIGDGMKSVEIVLPFEYSYDGFPIEISLFTYAVFDEARPNVSVHWRRPDGQMIVVSERVRLSSAYRYHISQDADVRRALGGLLPHVGLFASQEDGSRPLQGRYEMIVQGELREGDELDAKLVVYGEIHGFAGTDHQRRDLMVALLWGVVIGLVFGVLAAVGAQVSTFVLAGVGTWFGGKLDAAFQRITELNMILPMLPILIMFGYFYSRSIWVMLGLVIALNVFSGAMKTYRAMFLQLKEAPYIEAGQAYGAGNFRIIFRYLLPRIAPTLLPQFVIVIPSFVFLEATLAILGLGDPSLPTWGKVIQDAYAQGALYKGYYYWIVQPSVLLMTIGFGFALVGFSLDRVFNPKLRTI